MGKEAFRPESEPVGSHEQDAPRLFSLETESADVAVCAPDGSPVVAIRIHGFNGFISVVKGRPLRVVTGQLHVALVTPNLVFGSEFIATPCRLRQANRVGAALTSDWNYSIAARFDGTTMTVELRQLSMALRNGNLASPVDGLAEEEELLLTIPDDMLKFTLTAEMSTTICELTGKLILRNQR